MKRSISLSFATAYAAASAMFPDAPNFADEANAIAIVAAANSRPEVDRACEADRKSASMIEFARVASGKKIIDYIPGHGYFTRLFSAEVGQEGRVYAVTPRVALDETKDGTVAQPKSESGLGNVQDIIATADSLNVPEDVDLFWTSQNYHDLRLWGGADGIARLNKQVFDVLKPGGTYIVVDRAGASGLDAADMARLHRIDETLVTEVVAAGFAFDGDSLALNPADQHDLSISDQAIRGKTEQFVLRFRKPRKRTLDIRW